MPWSNNSGGGGGPWGGGGGSGGPWGGGGGRGGGNRGGPPRPPDLEEVLRKGQDRLRNILPGGMGSARGLILVALVVLVGWLLTGLYRVETNQQAIELVFGRPNGPPQGEGLKYNLPAPIGRVIKVDVTNQRSVTIGSTGPTPETRTVPGSRGPQRMITSENLMLTSDENILDIGFVVFWQVQDIYKFVFNAPNPDETVKAAAESAMRQVVGRSQLQFALTEGRSRIQEEAREEIQRLLDSYNVGIRIVGLALRQSDPPQQVIAQFRDVQAARADKERKINEANGYRNEIVPRAKGEAEALVQAAEAYRTEVVNRSQGDSQRFISVYQQYSLAKDITTQRIYLETMEEVLRSVNKVILDKNGSGVVPYLPLPELQKRPGPTAATPSGQGASR
ncbi:FtsH protease activity modulator HflK [Vineibacter terrae]|uniref:FtsH protease activity modulator HflK n=1 Tax=Vineibacter terrae TaxID=2586908 RepID=UPI002E37CE79|nr:FtsH protease activity modulator HflK [Vineibacter terrae]HEX2889027.1 FtsH protease activity modulator HflK [Vineibacter terrae]